MKIFVYYCERCQNVRTDSLEGYSDSALFVNPMTPDERKELQCVGACFPRATDHRRVD